MKAFHLTLASGLLLVASVYVHADSPDWSAYIGTGHAADGVVDPSVTDSAASTSSQPGEPSWNAFIGTGEVSAAADRRPQDSSASADSGARARVPWSARIGTGRALDTHGG